MANLITLMQEAEQESYLYFDRHIRVLPKQPDGTIDGFAGGFVDNDVDAFRHAYVSGRFRMRYSDRISKILGDINEIWGNRSAGGDSDKNMDNWNNAVGRKYGRAAKSKDELLLRLHKALQNGELIIDLNDPRRYEGISTQHAIDTEKPVIVLHENETGRNEIYVDVLTGELMSREIFVRAIQDGKYMGYAIALAKKITTPKSRSDGEEDNNLG